jgi:hypothetical protein
MAPPRRFVTPPSRNFPGWTFTLPVSLARRARGRFGTAHHAPPTQPDPALWPPADFDVLVQGFEAHRFRAPCAWYISNDANIAYARKAPDGGRLSRPVLFVNGDFDQMNNINSNRLGYQMRAACADLTVTSLPAIFTFQIIGRRAQASADRQGPSVTW